MTERLYTAHAHHDGVILLGTADYHGHPHFFSRLPDSGLRGEWTNTYELTPLNETIFTLEMENWSYWLYWMENMKDPHPVHYAEFRKTLDTRSVELFRLFENMDGLAKAEKNYQNQLIIDAYLQSHRPSVVVKAIINGHCDGEDTEVNWID